MKKTKKQKRKTLSLFFYLESRHRHPGGDRNQHVPVSEHGPDLGEDRRDVLRLHGDEDDVGVLHDLFLR
jgi:hypothetical protein